MTKMRSLQGLPNWIKRVYNFLVKFKLSTRLTFILISVLATIWFLVRVIPKPTRATYPCMQIAAPIMSAFVIWLISMVSIAGSWYVISKGKKPFLRTKIPFSILILVVALTVSGTLFSLKPNVLSEGVVPWYTPNTPVGEGRGINPGRVVWTHNPDVIDWDGNGNWYTDENINQNETDKMMFESLEQLTGKGKVSSAWNELFKHFNKEKHNKNKGYTAGEKICIKVNNNCTKSQENSAAINTSPQLILSVLRSLINEAGVNQEDITVSDPSRFFQDYFFNKLDGEFPNVHYEDHIGGNGRDKVSYTQNAIPYSAPNGTQQTGIANSHIDATYLINMAILKGHTTSVGVTFCAKNWFGSTSIGPDPWKNKGTHYNFGPKKDGTDKFLTFTDFMGHKDLGEKTILFMVEAIHGTKTNNDIPDHKWKMAPFNNDWPSSLFISQDGVAVDAVAMDFYMAEFPKGAVDKPGDLLYCDKYLEEAAKIPNPPSGTVYDPEKDGDVLTKSLGVLEHWNNAIDKQYSRNLNSKGNGIELVYSRIDKK